MRARISPSRRPVATLSLAVRIVGAKERTAVRSVKGEAVGVLIIYAPEY